MTKPAPLLSARSDGVQGQSGQTVKCTAAVYELVIFDCDGVLVDSEVISNEVLARMLTREGVPKLAHRS